MDFCRTAEFLYDALPLGPLRAWLIRGHMDGCPCCQARLLSRGEAKGLLVAPGQTGDAEALWRRICAGAERPAAAPDLRPSASGRVWRWAAAAALAAVVAVSGFWLLREIGQPGADTAAAAPSARFQIDYVRVGGAPAQTFVYRPQGTDTVFVWASRNP